MAGPNHDHNRKVWDERVRQGKSHTGVATERDFQNPGPVIYPFGWVGSDVRGWRVLCLAAGGGWHGPLYAAVGAVVTVVDISPEMLALDRRLAAERNLPIQLVEGSMDNLAMLPEAGFDLVIQPVSSCYVPNVSKVYTEVARVLVAGGLYISQHKQPSSLQADVQMASGGYMVREKYYRTTPLPKVEGDSLHREAGAIEYLHRWEELIGGLCRGGFVVEDLREPKARGAGNVKGGTDERGEYLPPFVAIKARRRAEGGRKVVMVSGR